MMEVAEIMSAISTVGFPIAACVGLFYLYDRTIKDLTVTLSKIDATLEGIVTTIDELKGDN